MRLNRRPRAARCAGVVNAWAGAAWKEWKRLGAISRRLYSHARLLVASFDAGFRHESVAMLARWGLFIE